MKKVIYSLCMLLMLAATITSCSAPKQEMATTQSFEYIDTLDRVLITINVEMPQGSDPASATMRENIHDELYNKVRAAILRGDEGGVKRYEGDLSDCQALIDFYGNELKEELTAIRTEDMTEFCDSDEECEHSDSASSDYDEEEEDTFPMYSCDIDIAQQHDSILGDSVKYVIYTCESYVYYGGPHGGYDVTYLTLDKSNGFLMDFVPQSAEAALQPLIKKGLVEYFNGNDAGVTEANLKDCLLIDSDTIPLPVTTPCPTPEGLFFVYAQYEIAPYAAGTPSFTIPYKDILPYLNEDAKALLGL